jgi:hypothetical protein
MLTFYSLIRLERLKLLILIALYVGLVPQSVAQLEADDPVNLQLMTNDWPELAYASYWGGADDDDEAENMIIDSQGNIIIAGQTKSNDLPVTDGAFQSTEAGLRDAFVAKFAPDYSLIWATYLGGDSAEYAYGLSVDLLDNIYVCGTTESFNFPVLNAYQDTLYDDVDGFISKFQPDGTLEWSTYFGGNDDDYMSGITVDSQGRVYVTGETDSDEFPVSPDAMQTEYLAENKMCIVARFSSDGQMIWSTYFGGSTEENGGDVIVDGNDDVLVIGEAYSVDCPLSTGFFQDEIAGSDDALLLKMDSLGNMIFATVIGGTGDDDGRKVGVDSENNIYIIGDIASTDFPTTNGAFQSTNGGLHDAFVTKFGNDGQLIWSTYVGGVGDEFVYGIGVNEDGLVYVYGETASVDFPLTPEAIQSAMSTADDAFITTFDEVGDVLWSTYFGGDDDDDAAELRFHDNKLYTVGTMESTDMVTTDDAIQEHAGWEDVYLAVFEYEVADYIPVQPQHSFILYPQPADNQITVEYSGEKTWNDVRFEMFNSAGMMVLSESLFSHSGQYTLNLADLPGGYYRLNIRSEGDHVCTKAVLVK